jgi:hypothetical protein
MRRNGQFALHHFLLADDRDRLGHSAMSAQMSGLPESGHGWTIYAHLPWAGCGLTNPHLLHAVKTIGP